MADVATLSVLLQARDKLSGPLGKMQGQLDQVAAKAKKMGMAMTAMGGIITGAAALSIKNFVSMGDEIQKMALRTGFGTEALSEWAHAVKISGSDIKAFENGIKRMASFVLDARDGLSTSTDALDRLGVSVKQLEGLSPEKTFELLSGALAAVPGDLERAALAQDVFGRAGTRLLPLLNEGQEGIAALRKEAHDLGIVFDQEAANKAAQLSDTMTRLKSSITGVSITIGSALAPVLEEAIKRITAVIKRVQDWAKEHPQLTKFIAIAAAAVGGLMLVLGPLLIILPSLIAGVAAFGGAFTVALGPVGLIAAAVAGLVLVAKKMGADWGAVWDGVKAVVEEAVFVIKNGIQGILDIASTLGDAFAFLPGLGKLFGDTTERIKEIGEAAFLTTAQLREMSVAQLEQELMSLRARWQELRLELEEQNSVLNSFIGMISPFGSASGKLKKELNELRDSEREVHDHLIRARRELEDITPKLGEAGNKAHLFKEGLGGIPPIAGQVGSAVALMANEIESALASMPLEVKSFTDQLPALLANARVEMQEISDEADEKSERQAQGAAIRRQLILETALSRSFDLYQANAVALASIDEESVAERARNLEAREKLEEEFGNVLVQLGKETFSKLTRDQLQFIAESNAARELDQQNRERTLARAKQSFDDMTGSLLFNFSEQGQAWKDLGGSAQSVLDAIAETTGKAASSIIANLASMRLEGESWRDLLLRLDTEGTINLENLAARMRELTKVANEAAQATAAIPLTDQISQRSAGLIGGREALLLQKVRNIDAGVSTSEIDASLANINEKLSDVAGLVQQESQLRVIDGFQFHVGKGLESLAQGGRLTSPGAVLVGERGPEMLTLPTGATVAPLGPGGRSGGLNVNVYVSGDVIGIDDLDTHITRTVRDAALRGGFVGTPLVG